jgi:signal transduction histidine kinase
MKEAMERCSEISKFLDPLVVSKISYTEANFSDWLEETIELTYQEQQALMSEINLETNCDSDLNNIQLNIPGHLKDVLINLIDNALDSVLEKQKESGSNYVPTITINASYLSEKQKTAITVSHNGLGIDPLLLEAFTSTKPNIKEMGLGLYTSKKIIELYKGSLEIEADCAEGASLKITIPAIIPYLIF